MRASFRSHVKITALAVALVGLTSAPAMAQAVFTNGSGLGLGIKATGAMGVVAPLPAQAGAPAANYLTGLSFVANYGGATPTWRDATTPGCLCEGFGFSANGVAGWDGNGLSNLTILDPGGTTVGTSGYTTLVALTSLPGVTLSHDYHPSASPNLYEVTVTITNTTAATVTDVRYNRTMDWDVPPTEFNEFVTLKGAGLGNLIDSCDDGFEAANPLSDCTPIVAGNEDVNFTDSGPFDIGARFTFAFGDLAAGASKTFQIYYGAAGSEAGALAALALAGAEGIYSFGQSNGGQTSGAPATFIFGFGGVGAPPIDPTAVPEPASMLLIGGGLAGGLFRKLRKKA